MRATGETRGNTIAGRPVAVVAAGHRESARAGAEILARGGNAVDAVCAASCAAAVAESPLTGPGAGGFLLARSPSGELAMLDFFVAVPGLGPNGRRLDPAALVSFTVPFGDAEQVFHIGAASVSVPGMVPGIVDAVAGLGRLELAQVVEPAVRLAEQGVVVTPEIAYLHEILVVMLTHTPESAAIFAPHGRSLRAGEVFRIPELADTYREIGRSGASALRSGGLGAALVAHLERLGGLVTSEDLERYEVIERRPLSVHHGDVVLVTNPPPSSGGALIGAALEAVDRSAVADEVGFYRQVSSAAVAANALRAADPSRFGAGAARKPTGTTHASAIDADGGMASLSSSCGSGGGVVVPGTGILLNNMAGEADLNPGGFGLLEPGARMTSMMAPTLVIRDGSPVAALGSAGSNRLRSAILQAVVNLVDVGLDLPEAVNRSRIHVEDGVVEVEGGVPDAAVAALIDDGHVTHRWSGQNLFFGGVAVAGHGPRGLTGAGDPRRGGAAAGVTDAGDVVDL